MSNDKIDYQAGMSVVAQSLGKGCLGGIGAAILFLAVGGLAYFGLSAFGLPENIVLFVAIASGPIIGTALVAIIVLWRARRTTADVVEHHHEAASSDTS